MHSANAQPLQQHWLYTAGAASFDYANGLEWADDGSVYVTGSFRDTVDFDPGPGLHNLVAKGANDIYVMKLDGNGQLVWVHGFGSTGLEDGIDILLQPSGDLFVTGHFNNVVDFDPGSGVANATSLGRDDVFLLRLDTAGNFKSVQSFGSSASDIGRELARDSAGNLLMIGTFSAQMDADPGAAVNILNTHGSNDVFISKFSPNGNLLWAGNVGSPFGDIAGGLALDTFGNIYFSGSFQSTLESDPGPGVNMITGSGGFDGFVIKLNSGGNLQWAKIIAGPSAESTRHLDVDPNGNSYLCGNFFGTTDFDPGPGTYHMSSAGQFDGYTMSLDSGGNFRWAGRIGGSSSDDATCLSLDGKGRLMTTGYFAASVDADPGPQVHSLQSQGNFDVFVQTLDTAGNFISAYALGGPAYEYALDLIFLGDSWLISGTFEDSVDFDPSAATSLAHSKGRRDTYVFKHANCLESRDSIMATACDLYVSPSGRHIWNSSGIYFDTLQNQAACDSIIRFDLSINHSDSVGISARACVSYQSPSGKHIWTQSGLYWDTLMTTAGCDSFVQVFLRIDTSSSQQMVSACESYMSPSGKYVWSSSGMYTDTLSNARGCDSIISINLSINRNANSSMVERACDFYISPSGKTWTSIGTYYDTIPTVRGCDSLMEIHLVLTYSSVSMIKDTACRVMMSPSGKYSWTSSGIYRDTVVNRVGCDSLMTIDLLVVNLDTTVRRVNSSLWSNDSTARYQWLDCNMGLAIMQREVLQQFNPRRNGSYAVQIRQFGCIDTSACYPVMNVGLEQLGADITARLFPNPNRGSFKLRMEGPNLMSRVEIFDALGKLVYQRSHLRQAEIDLQLDLPPALYHLVVQTDYGQIRKPLLINARE